MPERSIGRWTTLLAAPLLAAALATTLGACNGPGATQAWTGPGWYLEKSYIIVGGGPKVFGGPFTYEKCEEERIKMGPITSPEMLCVNHPGKPKQYGGY
ncbi:MAG: hypothetical protein FD144_5739 [Rhodospirillaceae bacterium]|nr:MAG: hypothetical protein FD144_5739 [Rhodospirillaceae bacterium]